MKVSDWAAFIIVILIVLVLVEPVVIWLSDYGICGWIGGVVVCFVGAVVATWIMKKRDERG